MNVNVFFLTSIGHLYFLFGNYAFNIFWWFFLEIEALFIDCKCIFYIKITNICLIDIFQMFPQSVVYHLDFNGVWFHILEFKIFMELNLSVLLFGKLPLQIWLEKFPL